MTPIFQPEIATIDAQLAALQAQIAEIQEQRTAITKAESVAAGIVQAVRGGVEEFQQIVGIGADAIARVKNAVLDIFRGDDNPKDDNGNQPPPQPQPNNDDGGVATEPQQQTEQVSPNGNATSEMPPFHHRDEMVEQTEEHLIGQSSEWASPLCCQMSDAPQSALQGQAVDLAQIAYSRHGFKYLDDTAIAQDYTLLRNQQNVNPQPQVEAQIPLKEALKQTNEELATRLTELGLDGIDAPPQEEYVEAIAEVPEDKTEAFTLVQLSESVAYMRNNTTGELICTYLGGMNKRTLKAWGWWLCSQHSVGNGFEFRPATRLAAFSYELKIRGMSIQHIEALASANTKEKPPSDFGGTAKRRKEEPVAPSPNNSTDWKTQAKEFGVSLDNISPGHYLAYHQYRKLGEVIEKHDADNPYYVNRNQRTMLSVGNGDAQKYSDPHEAAIGLAKFLKVVKDAEESKADLFGGGFDVPTQQPVVDAFGGFSF